MQIVTRSKGYRGKGMFGAPDPLSELSFFAAVDSTSFLSSQTFMHILNASWTCDIYGPAAVVSNLEDILSSMAPPPHIFLWQYRQRSQCSSFRNLYIYFKPVSMR